MKSPNASSGWDKTLKQVRQIALTALGLLLLLFILSIVLRLFAYAIALVVVGILLAGGVYLYLMSRRRRR
jgi:hypothetical protein